MTYDETNPYAAPLEADIFGADLFHESAGAVPHLRQRSVVLMVLLTVVTMGLYINYWVHQSARVLNQQLERQAVSMVVVALFWIVSLSAVSWTGVEIATADDPTILGIGKLLNRLDTIFTLGMAFTVRGALHASTGASREDEAWLHGFWTFLFGVFYLQWKINRRNRQG